MKLEEFYVCFSPLSFINKILIYKFVYKGLKNLSMSSNQQKKEKQKQNQTEVSVEKVDMGDRNWKVLSVWLFYYVYLLIAKYFIEDICYMLSYK